MRDTVGFLFGGSLPACAACEIRSIGVCAKSGADELAWLEDAKIYRTYASGDVIAHAGRRLPFVGSVMVGVASLSRVFEDGRHQSVGLLMPGDFLGRPGRPQTFFDVIAVTDVELCGFQHRAFDLMLEQAPELRARMVEVMLDELDAARAWMVMLGRKTAREKLCSLLSYVAAHQDRTRRSTRHGGQTIYLPLSREQIADFLALTLETVSRQFSTLTAEGLITPERKHVMTIHDHARLSAAAGEDSDGGMWS
jgi:CRP/FNR family transcriptional regulator, anaerobic regulatory protein